MRILIITQYFWPENFRINELAIDLQARGHEVIIYTGFPNYPEGKVYSGYNYFNKYTEKLNGVIIKRVPLIPRGKDNKIQLAFNFVSFAFFSCMIAPFRLRKKYEIIFVYEPSPITVCLPAILVKKIKKIPILFWVQDLWPESVSATGAIKSSNLLKLIRKIVKYIYKSCDLILVQSKAFISSIEQFGIKSDRIRYFPNSAERIYRPITNLDDHENLKKLPEGFRIIFAGNIGVAQSMETIINAAFILREYSEIHWVIIGDGRKKAWIENQVEKQNLNANVHLLGQKSLQEMPFYFSAGDVLLATLKSDPIFSLTIPSKIQSYLACGKPIIAAIDGETANVIKESGAGITVEAENADALANTVLRLYNMDASERKEMGKLGRKYFEENFDSEMLVTKLEKWMHELS